jgi:hypothetical protein
MLRSLLRVGWGMGFCPLIGLSWILLLGVVPSWARTLQLDLGVAPSAGVATPDLLTYAETMAQAQVSSAFSNQPDVTQIRVYVFADYAGQSVPILLVQVERSQWQRQPQIRQYSRPLDAGVRLLGLNGGARSPLRSSPIHASSVAIPHQDDIAFRDD